MTDVISAGSKLRSSTSTYKLYERKEVDVSYNTYIFDLNILTSYKRKVILEEKGVELHVAARDKYTRESRDSGTVLCDFEQLKTGYP